MKLLPILCLAVATSSLTGCFTRNPEKLISALAKDRATVKLDIQTASGSLHFERENPEGNTNKVTFTEEEKSKLLKLIDGK